jgi:hypothetical protein
VSKPPRIRGHGIRHLSPWISGVAMSSVGAIDLHDPAEFAATEQVVTHTAQLASLEELRAIARETEIDFDELTRNVNDLLAEASSCTVADVLARYPATQGVGSVIGLCRSPPSRAPSTMSPRSWRGRAWTESAGGDWSPRTDSQER